MKRINREFCLTDSSVNCYGYRLLTDGLELECFRPAVGFLMHDRGRGVAVQWVDFRREGDALYATPLVNDAVFPGLAEQIEEGFINAASVGHIVALEMSDDPADKLPGQDGPTVRRWFPREVSLVDIPGNYNALGRLYDDAGNVLHDLAARRAAGARAGMSPAELIDGLAADLDPVTLAALDDLRRRADRADALQAELDALRASGAEREARAALDRAVAEHRLSPDLAEALLPDYKARPQALAALLGKMPPRRAAPAGAPGGGDGGPRLGRARPPRPPAAPQGREARRLREEAPREVPRRGPGATPLKTKPPARWHYRKKSG